MSRLLATLLLATAACSTSTNDAPTHLNLFDGPRLVGQRSGTPARATEAGDRHPQWIRVHAQVRPEDRGPTAWPAVTRARLALPGIGFVPERGNPHELRLGNEQLPIATIPSGFTGPDSLPDGVFFVLNDELFLLDRAGRFANATLDYFAWIERTPRLSLFGLTANGVSLLPGESFSLDLPALASQTTELVFGTQLFGSPAEAANATSSTLSVAFNGKRLFEEALAPALVDTPHPHHVELPGNAEGQLTFHVEGGSGLALFTTPVVRAKVAQPDPRPDIVVFMADTFRADNLAAWGGDPALAPNMNALAASGLTFTGAHAPATWTLPSQASLLTSLYPYQHGATQHNLSLPNGLETLPERLRAAGYRTAAVTDGILVTARHGLDRGFELFLDAPQEQDFDVATLGRVRTALELDDGRPLFLYVQTYRAHTPYVVRPETLAAHPELFGANADANDWEFKPIFDKLGALAPRALAGDPEGVRVVREQAAKLKRLYRGGAADLDRGFGKVLQLLDSDSTILVLTSDHGESFLEHEALAHGTSVYEEEAHIPLVLRGPGIEPGKNTSTVSLVDLAPTLTALVGVEPAPGWIGHSLLKAPGAVGQTPTLSFMAGMNPLQIERRFAWYDDQKKAVGWTRDAALLDQTPSAFDLENDPEERHDLEVETPGWAQALLAKHHGELLDIMRARATAQPLELTDEERANLAAMGYTGD